MKQLAKQNNRKKLILTSVLSCVFIGLAVNTQDTLGSLLLIAGYISSLAFFKFIFLSKEKNLCFLIVFASVPFCVVLFLLPLSVFIFMAFIKKNKQNEQADAMYHRAKEEYEKGQFLLAEQTVRAAIKLVNKSEYFGLYKSIGLSILQKEEKIILNKEAEEYCKKGISARKNYDLEDSIYYLDKAIKIDSKNPKYYYQKGLTYDENCNPNKAKEELSKAIELDPNNPLYYFTRAEINYFQAYYSVASQDYKKGYQLEKNPKKKFLSNMEECLSLFLDSGKAQAEDYYLYACLIIDKDSNKSNDYDKAITALDKAIRRNSCKEYYFLRAVACSQYLLYKKYTYSFDSYVESLLKDLQKVLDFAQNDGFDLKKLLTIDYTQLLSCLTEYKINPKLIEELKNFYQKLLIQIKQEKLNIAWLDINKYENQQQIPSEVYESYYIVAEDYVNKKQFKKAKYYINKVLGKATISLNKRFFKLLEQIEKSEKEQFDKSIVRAKQYVNKKNLDKALSIYQGLLKENPTSKDIEDKLSNLNNDINKAEQLFIQSMGYFENGDIDETEKYIKLVTNIYKKQNYITLETDILKYKQCVAENEQNNYENAYTLVNELVVSYPNNSHLILLSQKITENLVKYLYEQNKQKISNGKFDSATKSIERMLTIEPENETYKNLLYIAQNRLVDISTCGKGAILTLEGFDEEKAKRFIKDREIMTWYDIESFAKYFNLQPHEQVLISDRLIFPLKPHIKQGRTIDM